MCERHAGRPRSPVVIAALAAFPLVASGYHLALGISLLYFTVLATAWALFSGPTHYISLATAPSSASAPIRSPFSPSSCRGRWSWSPLRRSASSVALVVGLSTLRLSGIYFVIFSFGLAELIRQLVTWYEVNIHGSVGRYIFADITSEAHLLAACSRSSSWCSPPAG